MPKAPESRPRLGRDIHDMRMIPLESRHQASIPSRSSSLLGSGVVISARAARASSWAAASLLRPPRTRPILDPATTHAPHQQTWPPPSTSRHRSSMPGYRASLRPPTTSPISSARTKSASFSARCVPLATATVLAASGPPSPPPSRPLADRSSLSDFPVTDRVGPETKVEAAHAP